MHHDTHHSTNPNEHPHDPNDAAELPLQYPLHVLIPLFGAFNIFLIAFIAVFLT